ncbi:MAG: PQQ-binding-like beta-propeller repeat protein [Acidobacteriota bacterium]
MPITPPFQKPLRLWPGVTIVALQWLVRFAVPAVMPDAQLVGVIGGVLGGVAVLAWWAFFSRANRSDRWIALVLMIVALVATRRITHESIQNGMMGMMFVMYAIPVVSLALVVGAATTRRLSAGPRRVAMGAAIWLACGMWTLVRTNGIIGGGSDFEWRWTKTAEERLLAQAQDERLEPVGNAAAPRPAVPTAATAAPHGGHTPAVSASAASAAEKSHTADMPATLPPVSPEPFSGGDWPGFRGPDRDDVVRGVRIKTDWAASPPVPLWRRPIGPGWSSFAVHRGLLYTQEQRGGDEVVACYSVATGKPVWRHSDAIRFWESNAGAGPRATPMLHDGRVYTLGATGLLNALDAANGAVVWQRNAASDSGSTIPAWGFSASPLVVGDLVIVHAGSLVAYDRATGERRWVGAAGGGGYSSPHLVTIDGIAQVLQLSGVGVTGVAPTDGAPLWEYAWPGAPMVQPALVAGGDFLITTSGATGALGMRRITVAHGSGGWIVSERWRTNGLKPYFNDFVVHKGHAFGFDGNILACIDLADGTRTWKGGRYGNGQLVLLTDQDVLLVVSEEGELALVAATPDRFTELARFPGIEGKTWNHPVVVGDVLLVRNGQEMAAFRLALAGR